MYKNNIVFDIFSCLEKKEILHVLLHIAMLSVRIFIADFKNLKTKKKTLSPFSSKTFEDQMRDTCQAVWQLSFP